MQSKTQNRIKILTLAVFVLFGLMLGSLKPAKAFSDYVQGTVDGFFQETDPACTTYGGPDTYFQSFGGASAYTPGMFLPAHLCVGQEQMAFRINGTSTPDVVHPFSEIDRVSLMVANTDTVPHSVGFHISCDDITNGNYGETVYYNVPPEGQSVFAPIDLQLSTPIACDSSTLNYIIVTYSVVGAGNDVLLIGGSSEVSIAANNIGTKNIYTGDINPAYQWAIDINGSFEDSQTNGNYITPTETCGPTSFSVLGVDIGNGICRVFSYLFIPNAIVLQNQINVLASSTATHVPFSYIQTAITDFQGYTTSTPTSTLLNFRMKIDAARIDQQENWFNINDPHFLAVWAFPYQVIKYSLWILLFYYLINRSTRIFESEVK